ncbi:MAG: 2-succinyl-6-hydroxy-2,4-cyclohexadiene-1-carboxylate synthase [Acinetobacter bereziniae]|uniref:2-succinyl-6-hydroxy-2, 4-cyclohexadiene-1-carboxylate synthase n=1 Tax=Acinetobacter bereziniae TaxID=106648 RepID=A0A833U108_ACIBZ|nr:MAG: 2-succinyl-6-hydroxy-2,4-cyclohexadiene-1-carboxylate synthase [Acinetobacter bereziniae]
MLKITAMQTTIYFQQYPIVVDLHHHPQNKHSIILLVTLGVAINKYQKLISSLTQNGFNVIAADYPHCGRNTPLISAHINYGYADLIDDFIVKLEQAALELSPSQPILLGHSLGGHLATLYAQNHNNKVIGVATGNIGLKNWDLKGKINILKAVSLINAMILKDGYFAGYKIAFGQREARSLMRDWSKVVFTGNYKHIIEKEKIVENQSLFIALNADDFAPMRSMLALSQYFKSPSIEMIDLSGKIQGNQHSAWIKQPEEIVNMIKQWVNKTTL